MSQLMARLGQLLEEAGGNVIMFHEKVWSKICIVLSYGTPVGDEALIPRLLITYKKLDRDGNEFTRNVESIKACYTFGKLTTPMLCSWMQLKSNTRNLLRSARQRARFLTALLTRFSP
jgi:hypothetical protein